MRFSIQIRNPTGGWWHAAGYFKAINEAAEWALNAWVSNLEWRLVDSKGNEVREWWRGL